MMVNISGICYNMGNAVTQIKTCGPEKFKKVQEYRMMNTKGQFLQKTPVVWLGALVCCALWGSAFPCIKIGYRIFEIAPGDVPSQILFAGCRFALAGILAVLIGSAISRKALIPEKGAAWRKILKLCMLQTVAQYLFFYVGLAHTTGVKASIIGGVNVFISILVASLIFQQEKLTIQKLAGCLLGFTGVVLVNLAGSGMDFHFSFLGEGFIFLSAVAYAFSSVYLKIFSRDENPVMLSGWQFLAGGLIMIGCGFFMGGRLSVWTLPGTALLIYMAGISAVAYSLWGILLKYNPVSKVAVFGFMNPVFGVMLSAVLLKEGESLGVFCAAALALVCMGIYIVNRPAGLKRGR